MDATKDYALLRLNSPIGNTYGWLELDTTSVNSGQSVKLISHPQGRSKEIVRRNSEIINTSPDLAAKSPFLLTYLADVEDGASGAPVFLRDGTGVIAIHTTSWTDLIGKPIFNTGNLMSHIVPEIQQHLRVYFNPSTVANQTFPVDTGITPLTLPVATGGAAPYTYTLSPIPAGLQFDSATRQLSGTPTTSGTTNATYTATGASEQTASLTFTIEIEGVAGAPVSLEATHRDVLSEGIAAQNSAAALADVGQKSTALLPNYPNPFNPETWIPYQLSESADVTLTIYNMRGVVVRELKLGHKAAGVYTSRFRAIHWDGRNMFGEAVVTGVYFYTLKAGDFTATRKMLIRK